MTEHEQHIAIAEWMGRHAFVRSETKFNAFMKPCCDVCGKMPDYYPELHLDNLPNYTRDLNAMHEAEMRLSAEQQEHFGGCLYHGKPCRFQDWCTGEIVFRLAHATAAQRAEALLRTLNLWRDDEPPTP